MAASFRCLSFRNYGQLTAMRQATKWWTQKLVCCEAINFKAKHYDAHAGTREVLLRATALDVNEPAPSEASDSIYSHPELYEAAFSYRNIKEEVQFLQQAYKHHTNGAPLASVLDLGCAVTGHYWLTPISNKCGPAPHSMGLAQAAACNAVALDLNEGMLEYARAKSSKATLKGTLSFVQGDIRSFDLQGQQFDLVLCMLGSFSHLLDNQQASAAFGCIAKHLRPGGVFILELAHPGDLFDGTFIIGDGGKEVWEVPRGKQRKILVEWGAEFDNFDPVSQILYRTVAVNVLRGDDVEMSVEEVVPYRQFTVQEVDLLATLHGLKVEHLYGEMNLQMDLNHEEAYRMIAVLKKA